MTMVVAPNDMQISKRPGENLWPLSLRGELGVKGGLARPRLSAAFAG